jgi:nitrate/TMAO reductase-like tetraheme cytochrome c subunit
MASSDEADCVLCHEPADLPPPSFPHVVGQPLTCRSCHQSAEVGGLPIDHALRGDATCLLCHDIKRATLPTPEPVAPG